MKKSEQYFLFAGIFFVIVAVVLTIQFFIEHDAAFSLGLAMGVISMLGPISFLCIRDRLMLYPVFIAIASLTYLLFWFFPARYPMPELNVVAAMIVFPFIFIRIKF